MGNTKLEMYITIVSTLLKYGPLTLNEVASFSDVDFRWIKEHVALLLKQGLIREERIGAIVTYSITDCGVKILRFFKVKAPAQ